MPEVLALEGDLHVEEHDDDLGELHRAEAVRDRQLLELLLDLGLLAHPGGVEDAERRAEPVGLHARSRRG